MFALRGKIDRGKYEERQWAEGLYWCTSASRERETVGKKVNGQEIDTVTILPMERVSKKEREEEREQDRERKDG